jgi:hypothetical protein
MDNEILAGRIRKKSLANALLAIPVLLLGILLLYMVYNAGLLSLKGYFTPYNVRSLTEINGIVGKPFDSDSVFVSLTASTDDIVDTGIDHTEDKVVVGSYVAIDVDGKYIICYLNNKDFQTVFNDSTYTFKGAFEDTDEQVKSMVIEDMVKQGIESSDAAKLLYGYTLNTQENGVFARTLLYLFILAAWAFSIFLFLRGIIPFVNVYSFPQVKKLSQYGPADAVLPEIEQQFSCADEMSRHVLRKHSNSIWLLRDWIVAETPLNIRFMKAEDLLWAYKLKHSTKYYGVITAGVRFYVKLRSRSGMLSVQGDEFSVDKLLGAVSEKYPWVIAGYSAKLESIWNTDIGQFEAHAEEKKAGMRAGHDTSPLDDKAAVGEQTANTIQF